MQVQVWWFEIAEMGRKFLLSALVVYMYRGSPQQVATGFFFTAVFLWGFLKMSPYSSKHLEALQGLSLSAQAITLFCKSCHNPEVGGWSGSEEIGGGHGESSSAQRGRRRPG